jgi:riboflavin kinase/FMN adenylyltransferase
MRVIEFDKLGSEKIDASGITIGAFDGVHIGHREIFRTLTSLCAKSKVRAAAITFQPLPREVFGETQKKIAILSFEERKRRIAACGVEILVVINFSREFAKQTGEEFMARVRAGLSPKLMVVGHDFGFGKGKRDDIDWLTRYCKKHGIELDVVKAVKEGGKIISSSRIRELLNDGDLEEAGRLMGEPYKLEGKVIQGHHRGKELGVATANLNWKKELMVPTGIYIAWACFDHKRWPAVVNIGFNPTFSDQQLSIEAHLLGFHEELYGRTLRLALLKKIRNEIKFENVEDLVGQIKKDIAAAKNFLGVK